MIFLLCCVVNIFFSVCYAVTYDCLILGAGSAGLSAALYAAQAHVSVAVVAYDRGQLLGSHRVENFPGVIGKSGEEILQTIYDQIQASGTVTFVEDHVVAVDVSRAHSSLIKIMTSSNGVLEAKALIIATGSSPKKLGIPGEDRLWGYGVSSCAVCDGFLYKDKDVIVIGGGNSAVEEALQLLGYARSITIIVRSSGMRATPHEKIKLCEHSEKIKVIYDTVVTEIFGDEQHGVIGVQLFNRLDNKAFYMPIDGVFLAIGNVPNTQLFQEWIELDATGHILLNQRSQATNVPGVFAAGDVADPYFKQAAKAVGDGVQAALEAIDFIRFDYK